MRQQTSGLGLGEGSEGLGLGHGSKGQQSALNLILLQVAGSMIGGLGGLSDWRLGEDKEIIGRKLVIKGDR